jgi:hypothetical protein
MASSLQSAPSTPLLHACVVPSIPPLSIRRWARVGVHEIKWDGARAHKGDGQAHDLFAWRL